MNFYKLETKNLKLKTSKGFTLIELLIYLAILTILITMSLITAYNLAQTNSRLNQKSINAAEAGFVMRKIQWALGSAQTINSPAEGSSGSSLSINRYNFASNPVVFDLSGGVIRVSTGGGQAVGLNNGKSPISNLTFTHIAPSADKPGGGEISFTLDSRTYDAIMYLYK